MPAKFDLIIIGSGTTGSVVASECRTAGWSVAVVDELPFGGTCALRGCDPKKVLVGAADLVDWSRRMNSNRTVSGALSIDWPGLMAFKRLFTDPVPNYKENSFEKAGIKTFHGHAQFVGKTAVQVNGDVLEGRFILAATGARPATLDIPGEQLLINSTQFLELQQLPDRIVFVGGGYIAMEFAHVAIRAGARVSILHRGERVLEGFDNDLVAKLSAHTRELGIDLRLSAQVQRVEQTGQHFIVHAQQQADPISVECDLVVHAAGRVPNLDGLDLETAGVQREKRGIKVNSFMQSVSNPAVYAGGDAAASGGLPLTPVAGYDGRVIAANLLNGNNTKAEFSFIPSVVFTIPPLASVGLSEAAAASQGMKFRKTYMGTGGWYSSRRVGEKTAASKVLVEEGSERILGAHLLGPGAEESINLFTLAMRAGMSAQQLKQILFSYPTHASDLQYML